MKVRGQFHTSAALSLHTEPPYTLHGPIWTRFKKEKSLALLRIGFQLSNPQPCRHSDSAIPVPQEHWCKKLETVYKQKQN
jgi:hypothetical protein